MSWQRSVAPPQQLSLHEWQTRYETLRAAGMVEPAFGGPLERHWRDGDLRLARLKFDNAPASLDLWNLLLTEEARLRAARAAGWTLVGTMKDLGTVPVLAYAYPQTLAFYPDGAWWVPCIMQLSTPDLAVADGLGIDESFCPVRAMLGAFLSGRHFPAPDLLICSVGATCDDFSAIAQRLEATGRTIHWWEMPVRRAPEPAEAAVALPGGLRAPQPLVESVVSELWRLRRVLDEATGHRLSEDELRGSVRRANDVRATLRRLRERVFTASRCPLPALEILVAEMLAIHYCSDRKATAEVLEHLLEEVEQRIAHHTGLFNQEAARVFWVNPVADLAAMNLLEAAGGRLCGTEFLFSHALDPIPEELPPMEALARTALADPMAGPARERAARICRDAAAWGAEAVVVSRIPGASHCALETGLFRAMIAEETGLPVLEIEVPPVCDAMAMNLQNRLEALVETVHRRRRHS